MGTLKAIILDFDGVCVPTDVSEYHMWREFYRQFGVEVSPELWSGRIGLPDDPALWHPVKHYEMVTGQAMGKDVQREMQRRLFERAFQQRLVPGIEEIVDDARQRGIKVGAASSSPSFWVRGLLAQHSVLEHFGVIKTIEDVAAGKPAPDLYLAAAAALNVHPEDCLAIEDAPSGAGAAVAAGIGCVVVFPNFLTRNLVFPPGVHVIVETLRGFDARAVFERAQMQPVQAYERTLP